MAIGAIIITYSYSTNDDSFWKYFDSGILLICVAFLFITYKMIIINTICWFLALGFANSWITSMFFNVEKFEINQSVFAWVVSSAIFLSVIVYNISLYVQAKKNANCQKEARDKYKNLMERISSVEETTLNTNERFIKTIEKLRQI